MVSIPAFMTTSPPSGYRTSWLTQPLLALFSQVTQWARWTSEPHRCLRGQSPCLFPSIAPSIEPSIAPASTSRHLLCCGPLLTLLLHPLQPKLSSSVISIGQPLGKSKKHQRSKTRQWVNRLGKSF